MERKPSTAGHATKAVASPLSQSMYVAAVQPRRHTAVNHGPGRYPAEDQVQGAAPPQTPPITRRRGLCTARQPGAGSFTTCLYALFSEQHRHKARLLSMAGTIYELEAITGLPCPTLRAYCPTRGRPRRARHSYAGARPTLAILCWSSGAGLASRLLLRS
jgi:hypothetical protein